MLDYDHSVDGPVDVQISLEINTITTQIYIYTILIPVSHQQTPPSVKSWVSSSQGRESMQKESDFSIE